MKVYTLFEATMRFGEVVRDVTVFGGDGYWQLVVTTKVRKGPGPSALGWWEDQTYPTGWETGETVSFRDGEQVACSVVTESVCSHSLKTITLEAGASPTDATALVLLFTHDGDGWPLGQTVMRVHSPGKGLTVVASTEELGLPEDRALCDVSLTSTSAGGIDVTFSGCYDASGDGTQHYDLSGALLSARG